MDDLTIDDPANIAGMSYLIDIEGTKNGFNPQDLEDQIVSGTHAPRPRKQNYAQDLEAEIDRLTANNQDYRYQEPNLLSPFANPREPSTVDDLDELLRNIDSDQQPESNNQIDDEPSYFAPNDQKLYRVQPQFPNDTFRDPRLQHMTNEEKRQNVIGEVFEGLKEDNDSSPIMSIEREKEEDEKARKLEQISFLRETLEDEGENLDRIPNVSHTNNLEEIEAMLKLLIRKNDRKRCCTFAEESILLGAHAVEWAFDGQRSYLGYRPDMTDWHKSVQSKLRRMRHDTSNVVGDIMQNYNLGSAARIFLELIPGMFLYSRMRRSQHNDNLISDDEYSDSINRLRDLETSGKN